MQKPRTFALLLCLATITLPVYAKPLPIGLDKLAAFAGTWKTEIGHFITPYSKTGKDSATITNDCWRSGDFYACHQYINGKSKVLFIYTYDAKNNNYAIYPIYPGENKVSPGLLINHGNIWTFPWERQKKGRTVYFRVINIFTATDTIEYREEYSMDKLHWYPMAQGYEKKQP